VDVFVTGSADAATVTIGDGEPRQAGLVWRDESTVSLEPAGAARSYRVAVDGRTIWVGDHGITLDLTPLSRTEQLDAQLAAITRVAGEADPDVRSPMPGTVVAVSVATGDTVTAGQTLLTVEAMKMEHKLVATLDGTVSITVKPADLVKLDQIVASIAPHDGAQQEDAQP